MVGERLRAAFEAAAVEVSSCQLRATVSIGAVAAVAPEDIGKMIERADAALYVAKSGGRNRVELAASEIKSSAEIAAPARRTLRAMIARLNPVQV